MQVEPLAYGQSTEDVFGVPVGSGPVKGLALLDYLVEATADLLDWGEVVVEVGVEDVDVVQLEAGEGLVD